MSRDEILQLYEESFRKALKTEILPDGVTAMIDYANSKSELDGPSRAALIYAMELQHKRDQAMLECIMALKENQ